MSDRVMGDSMSDHQSEAAALLGRMRETPMRRGAIPATQAALKCRIAETIEVQGVMAALAQRVAFQLVFKFTSNELADPALWEAVGCRLAQEAARLKMRVGLADRQIVQVLPKLSARQVEEFFEELETADRKIARTMLNAAVEAADPLSAGRRYLAEYREVVEELQAVDPLAARTLANATFTARAPRRTAAHHFAHFADLMSRFKESVPCVRALAMAAFRAPNPMKAAERFVADYHAASAQLASRGMDTAHAQMCASLSRYRKRLRLVEECS